MVREAARAGQYPRALERLDLRRPYKPLDVGEAGVAASVDARGRLLSITQAHDRHGAVVLTAGPPFAEADRFDPAAVRRFRRRLASRTAVSFGLSPAPAPEEAGLLANALVVTRLGAGRVVTFVPHPDDSGGQRGVLQVALDGPLAAGRWSGLLRLDRADYTQLTEGGPLPPARRDPDARAVPSGATLEDPALGWGVALGGHVDVARARMRADGRAGVEATLRDGAEVVSIGLGVDARHAAAAAGALAGGAGDLLDAALGRWAARWTGRAAALPHLGRRGLGYLVGCCAVPVGEATCLVTDHRVLPLAWTRDGYFAARALLDWTATGGPGEGIRLVRGHLGWLFEVAERPDIWWARSHLTGGQRKDPAFQLDQQLYPLLELADYVHLTGDREPLDRYAVPVRHVLAALDGRRGDAGLYPTDETPADDPLDLPYQTANQILAWRVFSQLALLGVGGGLDAAASAVARAVRRHLVVDGPLGRPIFAYASDLAGHVWRYHDANDLPLALAPAWGFCRADDPAWRGTIELAFSSSNPGYFAGRQGGLGSQHTPGAWPLGHLQHWIAGAAIDDARLIAEAQDRLVDAAYWDGSLPEASDPRDARPISRPWFAWPGALAASLYLRHDCGTDGEPESP